jgi:hypothetical protein
MIQGKRLHRPEPRTSTQRRSINLIYSFGEDVEGELCFTDLSSAVYRIIGK